MSEEKPLPCPYCRQVPSSCYYNHLGEYVVLHECLNPNCLCSYICRELLIEAGRELLIEADVRVIDWNIFCIKALEQRRMDFEAGQESASPLVDYPKTFDDYIKEQAK